MRALLPWVLGLAGCSSCAAPPPARARSGEAELLGAFDLPRETETEALSATWYDAGTRTLYALSDIAPRITPLVAGEGLTAWTVGAPIALSGRPDTAWDGEGLARGPDGTWYVVSVERAALIERFDPGGRYLGAVPVPRRFASHGVQGLESLSLSPSGTRLFFANEVALDQDGPEATELSGTTIRIHRRDLVTGAEDERAYLTDPIRPSFQGSLGVSDVTAYGDGEVLVLERSFQPGYGNTVRIYAVELASGPDVQTLDAIDGSTPTVQKHLVVDLAALPPDGVRHPQRQPNPVLDNYEALALGPILPDGRRVVFVTSDDNRQPTQVARVLTLALPL